MNTNPAPPEAGSNALAGAWLGLVGSPAAIGLTLLLLAQTHYVGKGGSPFVWLLLIAVAGFLLSLRGLRAATRSQKQGPLVVGVLGLLVNGLIALPLLWLTWFGLFGHAVH